MSLRGLPIGHIFTRAANGDRRALGRLLTYVERGGPEADHVTNLTHSVSGTAHVVGITGAPGAGKSTLTGEVVRLLAERGVKPAVLAVDPSSPISGGAILGDRIRMDDGADDSVFIRSMATRGHSGGLALAVPGAVRVFDAAGYEPIIIETVGVGQVEVDVAGAADTTVVVVTPGWGDAVQANKAGLLEVADVFVVNKADRPGATDARRDLELMLDLSHMTGQEHQSGYRPPIIMTTAIEGAGAAEMWEAVQAHAEHLHHTGTLGDQRASRLALEVHNRVEQLVGEATAATLRGPSGQALLAQVEDRSLSPAEAASRLTQQLLVDSAE